jgi:long-chain acyl-CoA synthetase
MAAIKAQTDQLVALMKALQQLKEKDVVTLDFVGDATQVGVNGTARGTIPGAAFNMALTRIWLGDRPVQADLKKAMLGG